MKISLFFFYLLCFEPIRLAPLSIAADSTIQSPETVRSSMSVAANFTIQRATRKKMRPIMTNSIAEPTTSARPAAPDFVSSDTIYIPSVTISVFVLLNNFGFYLEDNHETYFLSSNIVVKGRQKIEHTCRDRD